MKVKQEKIRVCGIYKFTNPIGQVYIGKSVNIYSRLASHKTTKACTKLGYSIRVYGFENHKFEIVEECEESVLFERERFWQDHFEVVNPRKGLNGNLVMSGDIPGQMFLEHRFWHNKEAISYEYIDYELTHENINYFVEGVVEIMPFKKLFFSNDIKINGTSIRSWMPNYKRIEINKVITDKINSI